MLKTEKKVEYLELIYDLIFVYVIGRNHSLLQAAEDGFIPGSLFLTYVLFTLAVIQIWNYSTYYINMFGRNSVRDHIFLFVNMYLLYYIGEGTRLHWESFRIQYHAAWALILINIGMQYLIERRHHRQSPETCRTIRNTAAVLFGEALLVLLSLLLTKDGFPVFSLLAVLFGIVMTSVHADEGRAEIIDFSHLSERAMLYVVFTFGEMIITVSSYFEGTLTAGSVYFTAMAFLIVSALFLSYEVLYNHIIDREKVTTGLTYMLIHVFLIFALNLLTTALEFMRDTRVSLFPKTVFLVTAFLLYYLCLFALIRGAGKKAYRRGRSVLPMIIPVVLFAGLMMALRERMYANIAVSVLFVYGMFLGIYLTGRRGSAGD